MSTRACSLSWYHLQASGLVKSMKPIPACWIEIWLASGRTLKLGIGTYPEIILPHTSVGLLNEVIFVGSFVEDCALLGDVWVDPNADLCDWSALHISFHSVTSQSTIIGAYSHESRDP